MAITFLEKRQRLRYLFPVLGVIVVITALILWQGLFSKEKPIVPEGFIQPSKTVEINFQTLKDPILEELRLFEEITPMEGNPGRENPFTSY